jgi:hypothetical protein
MVEAVPTIQRSCETDTHSILCDYLLREIPVTGRVFQAHKCRWLEAIKIMVLISLLLYAFARVGGKNRKIAGAVEKNMSSVKPSLLSILILNILGIFGN